MYYIGHNSNCLLRPKYTHSVFNTTLYYTLRVLVWFGLVCCLPVCVSSIHLYLAACQHFLSHLNINENLQRNRINEKLRQRGCDPSWVCVGDLRVHDLLLNLLSVVRSQHDAVVGIWHCWHEIWFLFHCFQLNNTAINRNYVGMRWFLIQN